LWIPREKTRGVCSGLESDAHRPRLHDLLWSLGCDAAGRDAKSSHRTRPTALHRCCRIDRGQHFHDVCEHVGVCHYLGHHNVNDSELYEKGIDRIYDVFAYEEDFRRVDRGIANFAERIAPYRGSSREFLRAFGEWLARAVPNGDVVPLDLCTEGIPVFVPALCDSSLGIGALIARRRGVRIDIDQIADTDEVTSFVEDSKKTGVVYVGGGVPKNFIQQTQVIGSIHAKDLGGHDYAIQYTTDSPHFGGLSGCTFEEAISWGKESARTKQVQVHVDATIALPLVVSALIADDVRRMALTRQRRKEPCARASTDR